MKRTILTVAGLALCTGAVVLLCWTIYEIGRIGTCGSGGPYVSARPCPPGSGLQVLWIFVAIIGGLAGMFVFNLGTPKLERGGAPVALIGAMWAFLFVGIAGAMALAAFGPAAPDQDGGADTAAIVLLVIFPPIGLAPLVFAGRMRDSGR